MKIEDIINHLEKLAPPGFQETYDNSGLICGNKNDEVSGVLICLDSTEDVISEAIDKNCNLVIAHHPIVFGGLKKITGKNYVERVLIKAIKNNISIYACHTNLDNVYNGVNARICKQLGLTQTQVLLPRENTLRKLVTYCPTDYADRVREQIMLAGAGNIGNYDYCSFNMEGTGTFRASENANPFAGTKGEIHLENEIRIETVFQAESEHTILNALFNAHPYEEVAYDIYSLNNKNPKIGSGMTGYLPEEMEVFDFLNFVKARMETKMIRYSPAINRKIKKVAVCGGAGSFLLKNAIYSGADAFITADYKYHQFFDAEGKILIADIGHYESEQFTKNLFYDILTEKFTTFAVRLSEINTNPVNYI